MRCYDAGPLFSHAERRFVALHTDTRVTFPHARLNPMISQALDDLVTTVDHLLAAVRSRLG